jgi:hypothetical protein
MSRFEKLLVLASAAILAALYIHAVWHSRPAPPLVCADPAVPHVFSDGSVGCARETKEFP